MVQRFCRIFNVIPELWPFDRRARGRPGGDASDLPYGVNTKQNHQSLRPHYGLIPWCWGEEEDEGEEDEEEVASASPGGHLVREGQSQGRKSTRLHSICGLRMCASELV